MKKNEWTPTFQTQAVREGWNVFFNTDDGLLHIQRIDDPPAWDEWREGVDSPDPIFVNDTQALLFVRKQAKAGEPHARLACRMHRTKGLR